MSAISFEINPEKHGVAQGGHSVTLPPDYRSPFWLVMSPEEGTRLLEQLYAPLSPR